MARLTIEEEFFGKVHKIANRLKWPARLVLGVVAELWHNSQLEKIVACSREQLVRFMEIEDLSPADQASLIDALVWYRILEPKEGLLVIRGNQKHIDNIENAKNKSALANQKRHGKAPSAPVKEDPPSTETVLQGDFSPITVQCSSVQDSTITPLPPSRGQAIGKPQGQRRKRQDPAIGEAIWQAIGDHGASSTQKYRDAEKQLGPLAWEVVQRLGGWHRVCQSTEFERVGFLSKCRAIAREISAEGA